MTGVVAGIVLIPLIAVIAPLLARALSPWVRFPIVVFELVLGIVLGPSVLGWVAPGEFMASLSEFGLAMLFFVAGSEIEAAALRGRTGRRAMLGWVLSLAAGVAVGWLVSPGAGAVVIGIALCSTALGTLLPIIRDAGQLRTPFGRSVSALGAVGEFGPLVAITVFLGSHAPGWESIVLAIFIVVAGLAVFAALRLPTGAFHRAVTSTLHTSGQFAVRILLLILGALAAVSLILGIDMLLGAFAAGIVWRLLMRDAEPAARDAVESKVEGIAFGFLVPIFFIYTGVTFDLAGLIARPLLFLGVPAGVLALLVVRGLPSMLAAPAGAGVRDRLAVMFLGATGLPIIVAVTAIGVDTGVLEAEWATILVAAGMVSVLVFPLLGMAVRGQTTDVDYARDDNA